MGVIQFRQPTYAVHFYVDGGIDVVRQWFDEKPAALSAFMALLDIFEAGGIGTIQSCVVEIEDGLFGLKVAQQSGETPCPIFCLGPFDQETEITFLAPGRWDQKQKCVRPYSAAGEAKENLELLLQDRARRRRG